MEPPKEFNKNGYNYKCLKFTHLTAIYEVSKGGVAKAWETHKLRFSRPASRQITQSDGTIQVINYPAMIRIASNEDFGLFGWCYDTKEQAEAKFEKLEAEKCKNSS